MKWTPCTKEKCKYYNEADAELVTEYKHERIRMRFVSGYDHVGHGTVSSTSWIPYPCVVCKHYSPHKLDCYQGPEEAHVDNKKDAKADSGTDPKARSDTSD